MVSETIKEKLKNSMYLTGIRPPPMRTPGDGHEYTSSSTDHDLLPPALSRKKMSEPISEVETARSDKAHRLFNLTAGRGTGQRLHGDLAKRYYSSTSRSNARPKKPTPVSKAPPQNIPIVQSDTPSNSDLYKGSDSGIATLNLLSKFPMDVREYCDTTRQRYQIIPGSSWGRLPRGLPRVEFRSKGCGAYFSAKTISSRDVSFCHASNYDASSPLIAVMAGSTTRGLAEINVDSLALFTLLFPSLIRSLDCGYRYVFVLGYDVGDPFYDSSEGMSKVISWFNLNVEGVLKRNGIWMSLKPVRVDNVVKKPGPVFLEMARTAYDMGAEFLYRVNDDVEFRENWSKAFAGALMRLSKPYGVVGPFVRGKDNRILTVDFVHRLHLEVFGMNYYPPELTDWWMDDWITNVYGRRRTFRARSITVVHHTVAHGQRYQVRDIDVGERLLARALSSGVKTIRGWMVNNNASQEDLSDFDRDTHKSVSATAIVQLPDIPHQ
mmetsp:Transcript_15732/g.23650  ORF Transcript_15732/g.23650 Transcript_15732/m.23650 type:complete len:493 (-) Transcript_15732:271-1749(-)